MPPSVQFLDLPVIYKPSYSSSCFGIACLRIAASCRSYQSAALPPGHLCIVSKRYMLLAVSKLTAGQQSFVQHGLLGRINIVAHWLRSREDPMAQQRRYD
jgi:hypothetical protein